MGSIEVLGAQLMVCSSDGAPRAACAAARAGTRAKHAPAREARREGMKG